MFMSSFGPYVRQYAIVSTVNLCIVCQGLGSAWTSPVLVKLRDEVNPVLDRPITEFEGSWIASVSFIAGFTALFFLGVLVDRLGRKICIIIFSIPRIIAFFILIFANKVWMVILSRFIMGLSDGFSAPAVAIYCSEIASKEIRGALGTVMEISMSLGMLVMLCIGPFLDFVTLNAIAFGISLTACFPLFLLPESPYFLYTKDKQPESMKILTFLRDSETLAKDEISEYKENSNQKVETSRFSEIIKTPRFLKTIAMVVFMSIISQLSGIPIVNTYLQTLLESTNSSFSSEFSSVIIGIIQLVASFCTILIMDKFGRKPILLTFQMGIAVGFVLLGLFFSLTSSSDEIVGFLNYLPLISLIVIVFCFTAGVGAILFTLISELLDGRIRAIGMTLAQVSGVATIVVNITFFPAVIKSIGDAATYWMFSITNLLLCLFVGFVVPETKGKSLLEIQNTLKSEKE